LINIEYSMISSYTVINEQVGGWFKSAE